MSINQILAIIAQSDPEAARLARLVLEQRRRCAGDVAEWERQCEHGLRSIEACGRTRLADISRGVLEREGR